MNWQSYLWGCIMFHIDKLDYLIKAAIPYTWDDSQSFVEFVANVYNKLNEIIDDVNAYFSVDLKEYTEQILKQWDEDGTLNKIINETVQLDVNEYKAEMDAHISDANTKFTEIDTKLNQQDTTIQQGLENIESELDDFKKNQYTNAKDYGAKGDGTTDDTAALQSALNAVSNGGTLFIPDGSYKISASLNVNYPNITILGDANTNIIMSEDMKYQAPDNTVIPAIYGNPLESDSLPDISFVSFPSRGDTVITVSSTAGLSEGDILSIKGDFSTSPWPLDNRDYLTKGETNVIKSIYKTRIELVKPISDNWTSSEIVTIKPVKPLNNIRVYNINIFAPSDGSYYGIVLNYCTNSLIESCYVEHCGIIGLTFQYGFNNKITLCNTFKCWVGNESPSGTATNGLSYASRLSNESYSTISHCHFVGQRHGVDISGNYPSRDCQILFNYADNKSDDSDPFTTHSTAEGITFMGNEASGGTNSFSFSGMNGFFYQNRCINTPTGGQGIYIFGQNVVIQNNFLYGIIKIKSPVINDGNYTIITDNYIENTYGYMINIERWSTSAGWTKLNKFIVHDNTYFNNNSSTPAVIYNNYASYESSVDVNYGYSVYNNILYNTGGMFPQNDFMFPEKLNQSSTWQYYKTDYGNLGRTFPTNPTYGQMFWDNQTHKPFWYYNGSWYDATGTVKS